MSGDRTEQGGPAGPGLPPRLDPRAGRPVKSSVASAERSGRGRRGVEATRVLDGLLPVLLLAISGWG